MEALSPARKTSDPIPAAAFAAELYVPVPARSTGSGMGKDSDPNGALAFSLPEHGLRASCQIRRVGSLLSIALLILLTVILPAARGQTFEILYADTPGQKPYADLVPGSDGNFYGITLAGGAYGYGTVFKVTPAGEFTTLVSFDGTNNGSHPRAGIVDGSDGNFYGTTSSGGASNRGTIYKITPGGELTTLVSFGSTDGRNPYAGLVEGNDGNFYGATYLGGKSDSGTIFKVTPSGTLTTLHSFDGTLAARPAGTPIFGSDGKLYGTADTMVIWRVSGLMAPAVATTPPKGVGKTTAELRGTVNANGSDTTVTVDYGLTPEYGSSIAATPAIITGASARPVEATLSGLTPHTTYFYRITATSSGGTTSSAGASFTTANGLPVARNDSFTPASNDFGAMTLAVLQNDSDADGDSLIIRSVTQGRVGMVTINSGNLVYTPAPGFVGRDTFSYTVSDGFASATAQVELRATAPVSRVLFATGSEVPGTGTEQGDFADEALFKRFGIPAINSAGSTAFIARFKTQSGTDGLSVFFVDSWAVNIRQAAQFKTRAPGTEYAVFSSFKDPLLSEAGEVAFIATVSDGDTTKENKEGIWISPSLEFFEDGTRLVARTGSQPPGVPAGARWKRFTSVALTSARRNPGTGSYDDIRWLLAFTAWMTPGAGGVDVSNDKGLWLTSTHGTVLAMREGQLLQIGEAQKRISSFAALKALPNASGQGNGVIGTTAVLAVQVFFTDGSQSLIQIWLRNSLHGIIGFEELARSGDPDVDVDGTVANFSLLTQGQSGVATAWIGNSRVKGSPAAVFMRNWHDFESFKVLAQTGDAAPGTGHVKFSAFQSMAINDLGGTLVLGRLTGRGIFKANDAGLWWRKSSGSESSLQLLAREGAQPPGVPEGAKWSAFTSMALPEGQYGPIFTARLTGESQGNAGPGGVTNANDKGLWAVDSSGELRLVVREGQEVIVGGSGTPKTLRSFTVLNAVPGSPAQRRSFAGDGQIIYRASFTDGSQAVVKVQLP